ncbi:hypothetical protein CRE_06620 [Caenorhabditis remanei]|uniref:BTB domain-containing protein n=1 Tax=Caenorhabditis remanei TaxID=31234 RepID=E3M1U0_CAERE|nr:hypothetical protein CRE_06620 [Caenorhabditis remanei]
MSAFNYIKNAKVWKQTIRPNFQSIARVSLSKNVTVAGRKWKSTVSATVRSNGQVCMESMIIYEDSFELGKGFSGKCKVSVYNQTSSEWKQLFFKEFSEIGYLSLHALDFTLILSEGEVLDYLNLNRNFEFEVQMVVERIVDRISITQLFNFYDPYHEEKMFSFSSDKQPKQLHTREQMIMFHSPVIKSFIGTGFRKMSIIRHPYYCQLLLQLVHGTQLQLSYAKVWRQTIRPNFQSVAIVRSIKYYTVAGKKWKSTVSTTVRSNGQICVEGMVILEESIIIGKGYFGKCKISVYNQTSSEWKQLCFKEFSEIGYLSLHALDFTLILSEGEVLDYVNSNRKLEFEIQMVVERIVERRMDNIAHRSKVLRLFNFYDPYPEEKMFSFCSDRQPKQLHTREHMIMFHSPVIESFISTGFRKMSIIRHSYYYELLLQLVHGTQLQLSYTQVRRLLPIANRYKVYSVVRKCEFRLLCLMEIDASSETLQKYFNFALWYNLKTLWTVLLRRVTSLEELKVYTSQMNVGTMPGEAMKKVTQRIFSLA